MEQDKRLGASEMGQLTGAFSSQRFCQSCGIIKKVKWSFDLFQIVSFWLLSGERRHLFYGLLSFENGQPWNVSTFT